VRINQQVLGLPQVAQLVVRQVYALASYRQFKKQIRCCLTILFIGDMLVYFFLTHRPTYLVLMGIVYVWIG